MMWWPHVRREAPALVALALPFAAAAASGHALPDAARADAWSGLWLYAGLVAFPVVDPLRRIRWDAKPLPALRLATAVVSTTAALLTARALFDGDAEAARRVGLLATVAVMGAVGNALPALPPNLFIGVRLPWTVRDRRVWAQTHRATGHGLVALALGLAALWPLFDAAAYQTLSTTAVVAALLASAVYSWVLSRRPSL